MKLAALLFAAAGMLGAASWDGTHGNITVKTTSNSLTTTLSLSTTDGKFDHFLVTIWYPSPEGKGIASTTFSPFISMTADPTSLVIFLPESSIIMLQVSEILIGQTRYFMAEK